MPRGIPELDLELFSEEALTDPYPIYERMRALGPVVHLPRYNAYALSRFETVKEASKRTEALVSGQGVFLNDMFNAALQGVTLCSDGRQHERQRRVILAPLMPRSLEALKDIVDREAHALVSRLIARGGFDAVTDLAHHLPLTVVSQLVGLPEEGRQRMLLWASATFNTSGPMNERLMASMPLIQEMLDYIRTAGVPGRLTPGSWGEAIFKAAERGEIELSQCTSMLLDYVGPSLDTTIAATAATIQFMAQHPEQWTMLREDSSWIPHAINEAVRLESPIQFFTRLAVQDVTLDGVEVKEGERVAMYFASANRCEAHWPDPTRYDMTRKPADQLGFGYGAHSCAGMHLARLEISALLRALAPHVERFETGTPVRAINNNLRGLRSLPITVH